MLEAIEDFRKYEKEKEIKMCLKKEQLIKINSSCKNNWQLDVKYFLMYKEKVLVKRIELDEQNFLEFLLRYTTENKVEIRINKFFHKPNEEIATSSGIGKTVIVDETAVKRRNINKLAEYTKELTDEKLLEIF